MYVATTIATEDTLRHHALISIGNAVVLATTSDAHALAILDHDKKDRRCGHTNKGRRDEAVLVAQIRQPWGYTIHD